LVNAYRSTEKPPGLVYLKNLIGKRAGLQEIDSLKQKKNRKKGKVNARYTLGWVGKYPITPGEGKRVITSLLKRSIRAHAAVALDIALSEGERKRRDKDHQEGKREVPTARVSSRPVCR